jgi:hypothetical protein
MSARPQILGEPFKHIAQEARLTPALKPTMTGLIRRMPIRQVLPGRPGAQDPKDAVEHLAWIPPRPTTAIRARFRQLEQRCQDRPLLVGQVHAARVRRGYELCL